MFKKIILTTFIIFSIICIVGHLINFRFSQGADKYSYPAAFDTTDYSFIDGSTEIRFTVYDDTTLNGWIKDDIETIHIRLEYEHFGTAYEYNTAKIYISQTDSYIDYVKIECNGQEIRLIRETEDRYNPNVFDNMNPTESIFTRLNTNHIILKAIS